MTEQGKMGLFRGQEFQKFEPHLLEDGQRAPFIELPLQVMNRVQRGTMNHHWKGVMCNKNPFDLALYGRLLWDLKPRTIIEIGYKYGGSALWFADQTTAMGLDTRLYCIDVEQREEVSDPRITFVKGDGRDLGGALTEEVIASLPHPWLVIEDADHHYQTCLNVLEFFAPHMQPGDYFCMEDGLADTTGNAWIGEGGPNRALYDFFAAYPDIYEVDAQYCDYYGYNVTWCTNGWLRRSSAEARAPIDAQARLDELGLTASRPKSQEETAVDAARWSMMMGDDEGAKRLLNRVMASGDGSFDAAKSLLAAVELSTARTHDFKHAVVASTKSTGMSGMRQSFWGGWLRALGIKLGSRESSE